MASTDSSPFPIKNKAWRVTFPILDADGDLVTGATSPDSEVSKDAGGFTDCTNEATEIATTSGMYYLDLTATEMNADTVAVIVKSGTGKTTALVVYPVAIVEPTAVPAYGAGGSGVEEVLAWLLALARNKLTQTATTSTLRNDADSGSIATSTISDDATTLTRGEWA